MEKKAPERSGASDRLRQPGSPTQVACHLRTKTPSCRDLKGLPAANCAPREFFSLAQFALRLEPKLLIPIVLLPDLPGPPSSAVLARPRNLRPPF